MADDADETPIGGLSELGKTFQEATARASADPVGQGPKSYNPTIFAEVAKRFFGTPNSMRQPNLTLEMLESALDAYFAAKGADILSVYNDLKTQLAEAERSADRVSHSAGDAEDTLARLSSQLQDFTDRVGDPAAALEGFKASISESLKLQEARKLWSDSAGRARRDYRSSWIALVVLLVAIPSFAIWQSDAIFGFFRAIGDAVLVDLPENATETAILIAAVSRLVLVTLPVALYVWLIRIVVRFNMRSLLLMDDANQRNTMLETYLHLVEQDAGVKADRPLILEALFRRTPGHGPDSIEPPNLADILRIGTPAGSVKP